MTIIVTDIFKYYHFFYNEEDFYHFYDKYNKNFYFIPKPFNENSKYIEFIMIIKNEEEASFFHKYLNIYWDLYEYEEDLTSIEKNEDDYYADYIGYDV